MTKQLVVIDTTGPLRGAGRIQGERRGTWVYYRPEPDNLRQVAALLDTPVTGTA